MIQGLSSCSTQRKDCDNVFYWLSFTDTEADVGRNFFVGLAPNINFAYDINDEYMLYNSHYFLVYSIKHNQNIGLCILKLMNMADKTNNSMPKESLLQIQLRQTASLIPQLIKWSSFLPYLSNSQPPYLGII